MANGTPTPTSPHTPEPNVWTTSPAFLSQAFKLLVPRSEVDQKRGFDFLVLFCNGSPLVTVPFVTGHL